MIEVILITNQVFQICEVSVFTIGVNLSSTADVNLLKLKKNIP